MWGYEPWGLMERRKVPMFDEIFRGYGMNKITWAAHIAASGYKFEVLPDVFMVHQPHLDSCSLTAWRSGKKQNAFSIGETSLELLLVKRFRTSKGVRISSFTQPWRNFGVYYATFKPAKVRVTNVKRRVGMHIMVHMLHSSE